MSLCNCSALFNTVLSKKMLMMHFMSCKIPKSRSRLMCLMVILLVSSFQCILGVSKPPRGKFCSMVLLFFNDISFAFLVVRAIVPRMTLDELFEQKGEVAKAVLEELEKVTGFFYRFLPIVGFHLSPMWIMYCHILALLFFPFFLLPVAHALFCFIEFP